MTDDSTEPDKWTTIDRLALLVARSVVDGAEWAVDPLARVALGVSLPPIPHVGVMSEELFVGRWRALHRLAADAVDTGDEVGAARAAVLRWWAHATTPPLCWRSKHGGPIPDERTRRAAHEEVRRAVQTYVVTADHDVRRAGTYALDAVAAAVETVQRGFAPDRHWPLVDARKATFVALEQFECIVRIRDGLDVDVPGEPTFDEVADADVPEGHVIVVTDGPEYTRSELKRWNRLIDAPLPLAATQDLPGAYDALVAEYPWLSTEIDAILADVARRPYVHVRPTLLVGPPGAGKSRLARRLAECLGVHRHAYDGAGAIDSAFAGTASRYGTVGPCVPILACDAAGQANPLVHVDEVDKSSSATWHGRLVDALLPFLEGETSRAYPDPALERPVDVSWVSYVLTANDLDRVPAPLRSRCRVVHVPEPTRDAIPGIARTLLDEIAREDGHDHPPLDDVEIAAVSEAWSYGGARTVKRAVEGVLAVRRRLATRH